MRKAITLLAAFVTLTASGSALAQRRYPVQAQLPRVPAPQIRAMHGLEEMVGCMVVGRRAAAAELLAAEPGSPEERRALAILIPHNESSCLRYVPDLRINNTLLRGNLAELLYEQQFPAAPSWTASPFPPDAPRGRLMWTSSTPADRGFASRTIARCYAAHDPAGVHALLLTRFGSEEERAVLTRMGAGFSSCVASARPATLNRLLVRAALAEALYQRAVVATSQGRN